jgi:type 1 glutamine amidotransferase
LSAIGDNPVKKKFLRRRFKLDTMAGMRLIVNVSAAIALACLGVCAQEKPIRLTVVVGGHAFEPSFFRVFDPMSDVKVDIHPHPMAFNRELKGTDVLLLYDMLEELPEAKRARVQRYLEGGGGVVILHHALLDYGDWPFWTNEVAGVKYFRKAAPGQPASTYKHDIEMKIRVVKEHPVVRGLKDFTIHDEGYKGMWFAPNITVLLETEHPDSDRPIAWISPYRKARVAVIQLGHGKEAHENPNFRQLVANAIRWAAKRLD